MWLLIPLHVGTDCRSGYQQLLTKDCDTGRLAGKFQGWAEMSEMPFFLGTEQCNDVLYVFNPGCRETSLINELITEIYILCTKRDVKNFCEDTALVKVLAFVCISAKRHMKKW